jgi:cytochrome c
MLRNSPEAMTRWIQHPQEVVPGNAMPDLGLSAQDAGAIAAYLETLR